MQNEMAGKIFFLIIHASSSERAPSRGEVGLRIMQKHGQVRVAVDYIREGRKKSLLKMSGVANKPSPGC